MTAPYDAGPGPCPEAGGRPGHYEVVTCAPARSTQSGSLCFSVADGTATATNGVLLWVNPSPGRSTTSWMKRALACAASLDVASYELQVIVLCQQGYQSSLAAASLQDLGVRRATDVVGGFEEWMGRRLTDETGNVGRAGRNSDHHKIGRAHV